MRLVSSFIASVFAGTLVGTDHSDASGTNILDIRSKEWHPAACAATASDVIPKLGDPADPRCTVGPISSYFVQRYGFSASCQIVPFCGDNPASLIGLGLVEPGRTAISLGTSDTMFGYLPAVPEKLSGEGHIFAAPTGDWMTLLCFRNGSLAREHVRDQYEFSWEQFDEAIINSPAGNNGGLMLPWVDAEIIPKTANGGIRCRNIDADNAAANCRGIIEGQMLSMRLHAKRAGVIPTEIRITGGASANATIRQIIADIFGCPVTTMATTGGAALGAALQARFAYHNSTDNPLSWQNTVAEFTQTSNNVTTPNANNHDIYNEMLHNFENFEREEISK